MGGGGVFWRLETTSNDLDLDFDRDSIELSRFLSSNIGDLLQKKRYPQKLGLFFGPNLRDLKKKKKKKKKKKYSARLKPDFCSKSHLILYQLSSPIPLGGGGLFSFLVQKSASKVPKTGCFAYSSGQWGARAPPPPPLWLHYWRHYKREGYERAVPFVTG